MNEEDTKEKFLSDIEKILNEKIMKKEEEISLYEIYNNLQNITLTDSYLKELLSNKISVYLKSNFPNIVLNSNVSYDENSGSIIVSLKENSTVKNYSFQKKNDSVFFSKEDNFTNQFLDRIVEISQEEMERLFSFEENYSTSKTILNRSIHTEYFIINISRENIYIQTITTPSSLLSLSVSYFLSNIVIHTNDNTLEKKIKNHELDLLKGIFISKEILPKWLQTNIDFKLKSYNKNDIASELVKRNTNSKSPLSQTINVSTLLQLYLFKKQEIESILHLLKEKIDELLPNFERTKSCDYQEQEEKLIITTMKEHQIIFQIKEYNKITIDQNSEYKEYAQRILVDLKDSLLSFVRFSVVHFAYYHQEYPLNIINSLFQVILSHEKFVITLKKYLNYHNLDNTTFYLKYLEDKQIFMIETNHKELKNYLNKNLDTILKNMNIPVFELPWWIKKILKEEKSKKI